MSWPGEGPGVKKRKEDYGVPFGWVDLDEIQEFGVDTITDVAKARVDNATGMSEVADVEAALRKRAGATITQKTNEAGPELELIYPNKQKPHTEQWGGMGGNSQMTQFMYHRM